MNKSPLMGTLSAAVFCFISMTSHAVPVSGQGTWETTLQGRDLDGNAATFEAYYDTTLDITWLADANTNGLMTWDAANTWASTLDVNGVTGWRLPTNTPIDGGTYDTTQSSDGTTDRGTATTTTDGTDGSWRDASGNPVSEMGYMFYVTLGNLGICDPALPFCTTQTGWGLANTGDFSNVQVDDNYWSGSALSSSDAWYFNFNNGLQNNVGKNLNFYTWAVRSGDVSAVPLPAAVWLFGSGLIGLLGLTRRKR